MSIVFWWGKLKGKRSLKKPTCRWEDNIKIILKK